MPADYAAMRHSDPLKADQSLSQTPAAPLFFANKKSALTKWSSHFFMSTGKLITNLFFSKCLILIDIAVAAKRFGIGRRSICSAIFCADFILAPSKVFYHGRAEPCDFSNLALIDNFVAASLQVFFASSSAWLISSKKMVFISSAFLRNSCLAFSDF